MIRLRTLVLIFLALPPLLAQGIHPVKEADQYPSKRQGDGITAAARLLSKKEVKKLFVSEIHKSHLVVEVALYPASGRPVQIHGASFELESSDGNLVYLSEQPRTTATKIYKTAQSTKTVSIYPEGAVGYESGTDPRDPRHPRGYPSRRGVYTRIGVGVGVGQGGSGSAPGDLGVMEAELREQALPEGDFDAPIAGYLYFPLGKQKRDKAYRLVFKDPARPLALELSADN